MASSPSGKLQRLRQLFPPRLAGGRKAVILPALLPSVVLFGTLMVLCAIVLALTDLDALHWWPLTISLWMAVFQVPFTGIGPTGFITVLGFLPLLPTLLYVAVLGWTARNFTTDETPEDTQLFSAVSMVTPLVLSSIGWGSLWGMRNLVFVQPPRLASMIALIILVTMVGVGAGLRGRLLHIIPHARDTFPSWGKAGFQVAGQFLLTMLAAGAVASMFALIVHWKLIGQVLLYGSSTVGIFGFGIFSTLYLPNMMVAAAIILAGGGIQIGTSQASLYATHVDQLPAFPLFAALPQQGAHAWWLVLLIVPAIATVVVARRVPGDTVIDQLKAVGFAVPTTAAFAAVGAWLAGGSIGVMGAVRMSEGLTGLILAAWMGILGSVTVFSQEGRGLAAWDAALQERRAEKLAAEKEKADAKAVAKAEKKASREEAKASKKAKKFNASQTHDTADEDQEETTSETVESIDTVHPAGGDGTAESDGVEVPAEADTIGTADDSNEVVFVGTAPGAEGPTIIAIPETDEADGGEGVENSAEFDQKA